MRSLRTDPGSTTSARPSGTTRWRGKRHVVLALTLASMSACRDASDPVLSGPAPDAAFSTSQAGSLAQTLSGCNGAAPLRTIQATPSNYRSLIAGLLPGDRLLLAAGTYTGGLNLWDKHGEPGKCIVIEGPASGSPALFTGSDVRNTVSFKNSSYIAVRNLSLDGQGKAGDGVKAEYGGVSVHHILIEGLSFRNFNQSYLTVGISTKSPAWNWVVRHNTITTTGTGMYFGNSDGSAETASCTTRWTTTSSSSTRTAATPPSACRRPAPPSSGTTPSARWAPPRGACRTGPTFS
jgi:hypothetical protein